MTDTSDMSPAEIKYRLARAGFTYAALDRRYNLPPQTSLLAAKRPDQRGEIAISSALDLRPSQIWPSRYEPDGTRRRPQPTKNYTPPPAIAKPKEGAAA